MYADWWYAWCLTYFIGTHKDVCIVLKKSLKWIPVAGWACIFALVLYTANKMRHQGMQVFKFIFLARSWASDRIRLASRLSALGQQAEREDKPLTLFIYPEGTLVSKDTRPISRKFADKIGIVRPVLFSALILFDSICYSFKLDMKNILLPRSTGLHYSLRSLSPRVPALQLIDITTVYPGEIPMLKTVNIYSRSYKVSRQ